MKLAAAAAAAEKELKQDQKEKKEDDSNNNDKQIVDKNDSSKKGDDTKLMGDDEPNDVAKDSMAKNEVVTKGEDVAPEKTVIDDSSPAKTVESVSKNRNSKEEESRTVFVGNLPNTATRKSLATMFKDCGKVESSRIRSLATGGVKVPREQAGNQKLVKKVAVNTNNLQNNKLKKTIQGYVVFEAESSIPAALELNGKLIEGTDFFLRVDLAKPTIDSTRSVFVGNLPYKADESTLRKHFVKECEIKQEDIENVRIVRDSETMQCRGFGYILLKEKHMIPEVLNMNDTEYMKKQIRVQVCGKRFKGKRGNGPKKSDNLTGAAKRHSEKFTKAEAKKEKLSPPKVKSSRKMSTDKANIKTDKNSAKKRGVKKVTPFKASGQTGISKRKESKKKVEKRVKKIQKRISKGMGKAKK